MFYNVKLKKKTNKREHKISLLKRRIKKKNCIVYNFRRSEQRQCNIVLCKIIIITKKN